MSYEWYVARYSHAQVALLNLQLQNFDTWLPLEEIETIVNGQVKTAFRPLFGPYLLVAFDMDVRGWASVNYTPGIVRLLPAHSDKPWPIPQPLVRELMHRETELSLDAAATLTDYAPGDLVDLASGPFAGLPAYFLEMNRNDLVVLLRLFGRDQPVSVRPHWVRRRRRKRHASDGFKLNSTLTPKHLAAPSS